MFHPQDFVFLALLLILAALALFFFTSLAGRLWCGYACPQTVYTEVFLWIERRIEGDRPRRMRLDRAPRSARKLGLKSAKHGIWLAVSLFTGFTFVGYFTPVTELGGAVLALRTSGWETFWILFYGFATYANAGWLREQVCLYMCPYARFQSAMFDRDTLESRTTPSGAIRAGRAGAARTRGRPGSGTASTARCACRCARPGSTSATVFSTAASPAPRASTSATR